MLSSKLIHLIESHEEEIVGSIIRSIHRHTELAHLGALPQAELRERAKEIIENLGHWLAHGNEDRLAHDYESVGKLRFERNVPLDECIGGLFLFKEAMLDFLDDQGNDQGSLAWYAAEQFERRVNRLFDLLVIHLVRGYEKARRLHTAA